MVKSSRPRVPNFVLNSQVNNLASQFSHSVRLGGDARQVLEINDRQTLNCGSTSSGQPNSSLDSDSVMSVTPTPAEAQCGLQVSSLPKCSALGFEVDLTGSQNSDTPFLRPQIETLNPFVLMLNGCRPLGRQLMSESQMRARDELFKRRRAQRLQSGVHIRRLLYSARQRLLTDLSLMVPGSIEQFKREGNGELDWNLLQSWLEGRPDLKAQMNLTTRALILIATYKGPSIEARSLQGLRLYAIVACKLDPGTYKELCRFLFPEDNRFSSEGAS